MLRRSFINHCQCILSCSMSRAEMPFFFFYFHCIPIFFPVCLPPCSCLFEFLCTRGMCFLCIKNLTAATSMTWKKKSKIAATYWIANFDPSIRQFLRNGRMSCCRWSPLTLARTLHSDLLSITEWWEKGKKERVDWRSRREKNAITRVGKIMEYSSDSEYLFVTWGHSFTFPAWYLVSLVSLCV